MAEHPDSPLPQASPLGAVHVPEHRLIRLIGKGSYGEVWLATNTLGAHRAVKIVYQNTFQHQHPFEREFKGVLKFEPVSRLHEGLIDVLQVGRNDAGGYFYCVMELGDDIVSGQVIHPERYSPRTLARDTAARRRLSFHECLGIGSTIASALGFLHRHDLVHRDVKPSNILFVNGTPKLADIGLVAQMSEAKSYVGTEGFIAPEGPGTVRADLYSLGKVLYEISTGKDRHEYPDLPTQVETREDERELTQLNQIILRACRANPVERYGSAKEMVEDFEALRLGKPIPLRKQPERPARIIGIRVAAAMVLIVATLVLFRTLPRAEPETPKPPADSRDLSGLISWWPAEKDGSDSGGLNHATETSGVRFETGKVGRGFAFDGTTDGIIVTNPASLDFGPGADFTIETWLKVLPGADTIEMMAVIGKCRASEPVTQPGYELYLQSGKVAFQYGDAPSRELSWASFVSQGPDVDDGAFHHVAVTVDRRSEKGGKLYIDARVVLTFNPVSRPGSLSNTEPLRIGGNGFSNGPRFRGVIDEPAIYDRALLSNEIHTIYAAGSAGKPGLAPAILSQPQSRSVRLGGRMTVAARIRGSSPLAYQWFHNGTPLTGATSAFLMFNPIRLDHAGTYSLRITNTLGAVTCSDAVLEVRGTDRGPIADLPGLVAWWAAEGNGLDVGGTNHISQLDQVTFGSGRIGQGFVFDGNEHRVIVSNTPALNFKAGQDFSIGAWIKPLPLATWFGVQPIIDKRLQTNLAHTLGYEFNLENGRIHFHFSDSIAGSFTGYGPAGPDLRDGKFHHVAVTMKRNSVTGGRLYVDGEEVLQFDPTVHPGDLSNSEPLRIGNHAFPKFLSFFKGTIDDIFVCNRALTAREIQRISHPDEDSDPENPGPVQGPSAKAD